MKPAKNSHYLIEHSAFEIYCRFWLGGSKSLPLFNPETGVGFHAKIRSFKLCLSLVHTNIRAGQTLYVSHTYSARMSSKPMGWSRHGADQVCRLRCYKENGGKIIDLIKIQR